jgi:hypothetical protein
VTISEICWDAVTYVNTLAQADADRTVQTLIDRVVAVLRRDPRMPPLDGETWRLLFGDVAARSRAELVELIEDKADLGSVVRAIVEGLELKFSKANRKPREQTQAEIVREVP